MPFREQVTRADKLYSVYEVFSERCPGQAVHLSGYKYTVMNLGVPNKSDNLTTNH